MSGIREVALLGEFPKGNEMVRITVCNSGYGDSLDIRIYFKTASGTWVPTKKGVMVPPMMLPHLRDALDEAKEYFPFVDWSQPPTPPEADAA